MTTLADLQQTVQATIAAKRMGTPVFVRYQIFSQDKGPAVLHRLTQIAGVVRGWLNQPLARLYALGSVKSGQITLTLECTGAATALVSWAGSPARADGIDLMVLGNQGALYHDAGTSILWDEPATPPTNPADKQLRGLIEQALQASQPVVVKKGARAVSNPRYGVLLVTGSHTHQENYAAAFAADARCQLIGVTDEANIDKRRRELNERLAQQLNVPYIANLKNALSRKDVHIVSVCAPPERRGRISVLCAEARKHLYLDKSLCPTLKEADALVTAVQKAAVKSHMFCFISQPWAKEAKRWIDDKQLGTLRTIHADTFFAKGRNGTAKLGTRRKEEFPPQRHQLVDAKRELDNVGVYPIVLIRWLTGRRFRTVLGITANYFFQEHQKRNVEDFGLLSCTLDGGLPVTITAGRCGWTAHPAAGVNRVVLIGSSRTVVIDANRPRVEVYSTELPWTPPAVHKEDPMGFWTSTQQEVHVRPKLTWVNTTAARSDAAYFLDRLDKKQDSEVNVAEAALATEVLVAAYRSANTGQVVNLPMPRN